jgi:predicted acylesterase/phospholipase RssA
MLMDYNSHPHLSLVQALRMTSCIPGFLRPVLYEGLECFDGGIVDNYLIHLFEPEDVLGIYLGLRCSERETSEITRPGRLRQNRIFDSLPIGEGLKTFADLMWDLFSIISNQMEELRRTRPYREIIIPSRGVSTLSLTISMQRKYQVISRCYILDSVLTGPQMILDGMKEALKFVVAET